MSVTEQMINAADSVLSRVKPGIPDETIRLALTAALSHADHGGVKVMAMEWKLQQYPQVDGYENDASAKCALGTYNAYSYKVPKTEEIFHGWNGPFRPDTPADSFEAAKAAAQADYEARILSALTQAPAPTLTGEVEKALKEQIEAAREFVKRHPALTIIDLAEFEAFLKVPAAIASALDALEAENAG